MANLNGAGQVQRWLPIVAAGALAAYVLKRRLSHQSRGKGTGVIADRDSDTRHKLSGPRGIRVEHSVLIRRPAAELYRFWRNLENLPTFMEHLESVAMREEGVSHWVAHGPAGIPAEWDARIINEVPGKLIAWQSLTGSMISTAGSVHFDETNRGTVVRVHLQYSPPGGSFGAALAYAFGEEPHLQIQEDLQRFKLLMEAGATQAAGSRQ